MGHYSVLNIGPLSLKWKYTIPTFLTFLFNESDLYCKAYEDEDDSNAWEEIGYSTTVRQALAVLDSYGYNITFFSDIYDTFYADLNAHYSYLLTEDLAKDGQDYLDEREVDTLVKRHLRKFPSQTREDDLRDFVAFLRRVLATAYSPAISRGDPTLRRKDKSYNIPSPPGVGWEKVLTSFYEMGDYFFDKSLLLPPSVMKVALMFDESYLMDYPEVVSLMFTRLTLDAMDEDQTVFLDLSDIADSKEEVKETHAELAKTLAQKLYLYNRVFRVLSDRDVDIRERFAKTKARGLLRQLGDITDNNEKGILLEDLVSTILEGHPGLKVEDKRRATGDEEIDLVIKNNMDRPFWIGLNSPLIFVECKNWSNRVGAKEIRDFEGKIRDHRLVRVGLFIAPGGFSDECFQAVRRIGRDEHSIILMGPESLERFANSDISVPDWMEEYISRIV